MKSNLDHVPCSTLHGGERLNIQDIMQAATKTEYVVLDAEDKLLIVYSNVGSVTVYLEA